MGKINKAVESRVEMSGQTEVAHYLHWLGGQAAARRMTEAKSLAASLYDGSTSAVPREYTERQAIQLVAVANWLEEATPGEVAAYMGIRLEGARCPHCKDGRAADNGACDVCLGVGYRDPLLVR